MPNPSRATPRGMFLFLCALLLGACASSGPETRADYDHAADFSAYRTFAFFEPLGTDTSGYESLITQTLKAATRREMESRGYAFVESAPDLLINFNAKLSRETRVSQVPAPMPMYYGYRQGYYGGWSAYQTRVDEFVEGTLNIDMVDARRQQLVWEGVAVGRIRDRAGEERRVAINEAVSEIFRNYPFRVAD